MNTQKLKVLSHMRSKKGGITSWEAITEYRITRLAARVKDLRDDGHEILTTIESDGEKHYARYTLIKEKSYQ